MYKTRKYHTFCLNIEAGANILLEFHPAFCIKHYIANHYTSYKLDSFQAADQIYNLI